MDEQNTAKPKPISSFEYDYKKFFETFIQKINNAKNAVMIGDEIDIKPSGGEAMEAATKKVIQPIYKTQKANGIYALAASGYHVPGYSIFTAKTLTDPNTAWQCEYLVDKFVRPCPVTPRHGFVDSRPVFSLEQAKKLVEETLAADPDAEIVTMPFIEAECSAIWTNGKLVLGASNDGATSGHESFSLPVLGIPHTSYGGPAAFEKACDLGGIKDAPYVEMVWEKQKLYSEIGAEGNSYTCNVVQLRNGPKLPNAVDFIPKSFKVKNVVIAEGDLLEWETRAKNFPAGTVVYHPGGSLASHYAVHAVINNIAVVTSFEPKVGEIIKAVSTKPQPDITKMRAGFIYACTAKMSPQQAVRVMLAGVHNASVWYGVHDELIGMAAGCAYRLIVTASLGEYRHKCHRVGNSNSDGDIPTRNAVYKKAWDCVLKQDIRAKYLSSVVSFQCDNWRGSFGGRKWFEVSQWGGKIYNSLLDGNAQELVENLNKAMNAVHNGGWAFDKFTERADMDKAAANPMFAIQSIAPILYIGHNEVLKNKEYLTRYYTRRRKLDVEERSFPPRGKVQMAVARLTNKGYTLEIEYVLHNMGGGYQKKDKFRKVVQLNEEGKKALKTAFDKYDSSYCYWYEDVTKISSDSATYEKHKDYTWSYLHARSKYNASMTKVLTWQFGIGGGSPHNAVNLLDKEGNMILDEKYILKAMAANV